MPISSENVVSIAGLYLALVGLLSSFFFVHLGQWLNAVLATQSKWLIVKGRPNEQFFEKKLECYYEAQQSASKWTFIGWLAVTIFLLILGVFLLILYRQLQGDGAALIFQYVNLPCYFFLGLYLCLSIVMLRIGYKKAKDVRDKAFQEL